MVLSTNGQTGQQIQYLQQLSPVMQTQQVVQQQQARSPDRQSVVHSPPHQQPQQMYSPIYVETTGAPQNGGAHIIRQPQQVTLFT